jgi:hypothetical protein
MTVEAMDLQRTLCQLKDLDPFVSSVKIIMLQLPMQYSLLYNTILPLHIPIPVRSTSYYHFRPMFDYTCRGKVPMHCDNYKTVSKVVTVLSSMYKMSFYTSHG